MSKKIKLKCCVHRCLKCPRSVFEKKTTFYVAYVKVTKLVLK
jgi:hypothetical protein